MPKDKPQETGTRGASGARRALAPVETWSAVSKLPADVAERIVQERRLEITPSLIWGRDYPEEGIHARILSAQDRVAAIDAQSPTEAMLAIQLVNTHEACTECHRRAMMSADNPVAFAAHMKNADQLSSLYIRQLAALDKHRGHGKQQVRVEHVTVAAGGQAIVGKIDINPRAEPATRVRQGRTA